jgi:hypothetical protein
MSKLNKTIDCFKNPKDAQGLLYCHPMLLLIVADMMLYISASGYSPVVTSLIRTPHEDRLLGAVGTAHQEGRGADIRCNDWSKEFKLQFESHFEAKYKGYGAISSKTGKENMIEIHGEGDSEHVHIQLKKDYQISNAWSMVKTNL